MKPDCKDDCKDACVGAIVNGAVAGCSLGCLILAALANEPIAVLLSSTSLGVFVAIFFIQLNYLRRSE